MTLQSDKVINQWLEDINTRDLYWKSIADQIYEQKLELTDPVIIKINYIRQVLRFYIIPLLENTLTASDDKKKYLVKYLELLGSEEKFDHFIAHFFQVSKKEKSGWAIENRDQFQHDCFVLYDLLKSKLAINGITLLQKKLEASESAFPSVFSKKEQLNIIKKTKRVLLITSKQSLKLNYVNQIYKNIDINFITPNQTDHRKENNIIFAHPDIASGSPYRRIYLHLLFRKKITTQWKSKEVTIQYDLIDFEHLKYEYLKDWVYTLNDHPEKIKIYEKLFFKGRPFIEELTKSPHQELDMLDQLPLEAFNDTIARISESVEPEKKPILEPVSNEAGIIKELNANFQTAITKLKGNLSNKKGIIKNVLINLEQLSGLPTSSTILSQTKTDESIEALSKKFYEPILLYKKYDVSFDHKTKIAVLLGNDLPLNMRSDLLQQEIIKSFDIDVLNIDEIDQDHLKKYRFVITLRCLILEPGIHKHINNKKDFTAEIIEAESIFNSKQKSDYGPDYLQLFQELEIKGDENVSQDNQLALDLKKWQINQAILKIDQSINHYLIKVKPLLPHYLSLIQWLTLEIFLEQGHLKKLVPALLNVNRYLVIDAFKELSAEYLNSIGFNKKLITTWGRKQLKKSIEDFQPETASNSVQIIEWLKQFSFNRYELVIYIDWQNSQNSELPIYFRSKNIQGDSKTEDSVRIYYFNLLHFFSKEFSFMDHYQLIEKGMGFTNEQLYESPDIQAIYKIRNSWQEINILERQKEKLQDYNDKLEIELAKENPNSLLFLKEEYFVNRVNLLLEAYLKREASIIAD